LLFSFSFIIFFFSFFFEEIILDHVKSAGGALVLVSEGTDQRFLWLFQSVIRD